MDPADFVTFIKAFRGLQCKKEDNQIELRNLVLEWKSRLRNDQNTHDIRTQAYELIDIIESFHDEQDMLLESENKKLELLVRECAMDNAESRRISVDIGGVDMDKQSDVSYNSDGLPGTSGDIGTVAMDKHSDVSHSNRFLQGTRGGNSSNDGDFTDLHKEISRRQQYLQMFNNQSTFALKRALLDIEACRKMVDYSKDFVDNISEEVSSSSESSDGPFPHPV